MKKGHVWVAAAGVLLSGCALVPAESPGGLNPKIVPTEWQSPQAALSRVRHPQKTDLSAWWAAWKDPELLRLIEQSELSNTDIRSARENLRFAREAVLIADAGLFPSADGSARAARNRANGRSSNNYSIGLNVSWTLDAGGRYAASEAAYADYLQSEATLGEVQSALAAQVGSAYIKLRLAEKRTEVARDNLAAQKESADIAAWRYKAGLVSSTDVDQAQASLEQTRASIPLYEAQIRQYRNLLARLTSVRPEDIRIPKLGAVPEAPSQIALSIPGEVLRQRPDVRRAEAALKAAYNRLSEAKSALFPSLTIGGSVGLSALTPGALGEAGTHTSSLFGTLSLPIFNAGSLMARVRQMDARVAKAQTEYEAALLTGVQQVEDALNSVYFQKQRAQSLNAAVDFARSAASAARQNYSAGLQDFTVVLTTQRTLLGAEEAQAQTQADISLAYISLYEALGGGWKVPEPFKEYTKDE